MCCNGIQDAYSVGKSFTWNILDQPLILGHEMISFD